MKVTRDRVVTVDHTVADDAGIRRDDGEPMRYVHGHGAILPALEQQFEGLETGDCCSVILEPERAYGAYREHLVFEVERTNLPEGMNPAAGEWVRSRTGEREFPLYVRELRQRTVILDGNHPLAGRTLHFECRIREVREATADEREQGRARIESAVT